MTVFDFLKNHYIPNFRIVTYLNWKTEILYDSSLTVYDVPNIINNSIIENIYEENGIIEIEI